MKAAITVKENYEFRRIYHKGRSAVSPYMVVYCLKNTSILAAPHGIPELIAVALVVVLHKWRHNTLLSIVCGTVCYMLLVQLVF